MKAIEESYQSPPKSLALNAALNLMIHHRRSFRIVARVSCTISLTLVCACVSVARCKW